jgi:hypothetical protein
MIMHVVTCVTFVECPLEGTLESTFHLDESPAPSTSSLDIDETSESSTTEGLLEKTKSRKNHTKQKGH